MSAPDRRSCPVLTCSNTMGEQIMCTTCWMALPHFMRVAVDTCTRAVKNQPTQRNRARFETAIANAVRSAATVRS